jgi:hypothetical protein
MNQKNDFKLSFKKQIIYPVKEKNPTLKNRFLILSLIVTAFVLFSAFFSSCKTCKCPAYTINNTVMVETVPV